jgi:uncharacterized membrane protein YfcA
MFVLYFLIGIFSGTMSGLLGIGGGIIVVPVLALLFRHYALIPVDHVMQMAIGTSLAVMIMTAFSALNSHIKRGTVRWDLVKKLLPGLIFGAILGSLVTTMLPSHYLRILFSIFLFCMACRILCLKMEESLRAIPARWVMTSVACVIGFLSSVLGAGGGTMMIPFMLRYRVTMREAAGTSVACGAGVGFVATFSFMILGASVAGLPWSSGYIYWPAFLGVSLASMIFAPIGTDMAHRLPTLALKRILGIFLLFISIDMLLTG